MEEKNNKNVESTNPLLTPKENLAKARILLNNGEIKETKRCLKRALKVVTETPEDYPEEIEKLWEMTGELVAIQNVWLSYKLEPEKTKAYAAKLKGKIIPTEEKSFEALDDIFG